MILVIAEKPSVAQSIAKALGAASHKDGYLEGNNYIVSWCVGHLVGLADASSYDDRYAKWRYDDLPIVPEKWLFEVPKDKTQQFKVLRDLMKDKRVTELVCATDAGREGELIFRLVYNKAGCTKPFKRLWISSLEDAAIREGFRHLHNSSEYDRLYEAALSRSKADWIVGINGTRLFSTLYNRKLVVGRVQTPTLAMLVERDGKISNFKKEKYFNVHVSSGGLTADMEKIKTEDEAKTIAAACDKKQAVVSSVRKETKAVNPPKLYDLTTLQREANRYYAFTAQQTLDLVQSLYEKKLLTYPRTDSQFITDDMEYTALAVIDIICRKLPVFDGIRHKVRVVQSKDETEWVKVENAHEALVSYEDFMAVKTMMKRDMRCAPDQDEAHLFSGFLFCGDCQQSMIRKTVPSKAKKYIYYVCSTNKHSRSCTPHSISAKEVEEKVFTAIHDQIELVINLEKALELIERLPSQSRKAFNYEAQITKLEEEIDRYQKLKLRLYEDLSDGIIDKSEYFDFRNSYTRIIEEKQEALLRVKKEMKQTVTTGTTERNWVTLFKQYENIEELNRRVLMALVDRILIHENHASVTSDTFGLLQSITLFPSSSLCIVLLVLQA